MAKPIELKPYLTTEELRKRYQTCHKAQEKVRWRALYLISKGVVGAEAAKKVGRVSSWMTALARRYNAEGAEVVARRKGEQTSHRASLDAELGEELRQALQGKAPDQGLWTGVKVARWIAGRTGKEVHRVTGWRTLERLGFSLQTPRPQNRQRASLAEQTEFKKN